MWPHAAQEGRGDVTTPSLSSPPSSKKNPGHGADRICSTHS